ncbi:MAG: ATP synthase F1 subunit gamma [Candidatus Aminicenantes bacterium]|nr:ATP synthase F1 subunit gamma [Candidatus Aminicenantes bacterium]
MAGNLIYLRRRIKSVKNTQKLTRAMKTVAAAKLRRATAELKKTRPHRDKIAFLLQQSGSRVDLSRQPLLKTREQGSILLVIIASDKGLCGAFNSQVLKQSENYCRELLERGEAVSLVTIGTKASRYFSKHNLALKTTHNGMISRLQFADASRLAATLLHVYRNEDIKRVEFVFQKFMSVSRQQFTVRQLFPLEMEWSAGAGSEKESEAERTGYIFEPGAQAIFEALLPRFITDTVYQMLLQSMAAEQISRMVAMDLATRNASDMIRSLTLLLNKMRQASITKELLEIITATEALNK